MKKLINKKFGRLKVLKDSKKRNSACQIIWKCQCNCGKIVFVSGTNLRVGKTKSCGCLRIEKMQLNKGMSARNSLYRNYKAGAKRRKLKFKLLINQFTKLTKQVCYYCGIKPQQIYLKDYKEYRYNGNYIYNGIDRINSNKGYEINNVVTCCKDCNIAKQRMTIRKYKLFIKRVYNNLYEC